MYWRRVHCKFRHYLQQLLQLVICIDTLFPLPLRKNQMRSHLQHKSHACWGIYPGSTVPQQWQIQAQPKP